MADMWFECWVAIDGWKHMHARVGARMAEQSSEISSIARTPIECGGGRAEALQLGGVILRFEHALDGGGVGIGESGRDRKRRNCG